ncbi:TPA: hypothetical protein ACF2DD_002110 [Clostridium perfringens]
MKEIKIFRDKDNLDTLEIHSNDFIITYVEACKCYGLQCSFNGDTEAYNKVLKIIKQIADSVRELEKVYK